mgnify:CR=1 FL=1
MGCKKPNTVVQGGTRNHLLTLPKLDSSSTPVYPILGVRAQMYRDMKACVGIDCLGVVLMIAKSVDDDVQDAT